MRFSVYRTSAFCSGQDHSDSCTPLSRIIPSAIITSPTTSAWYWAAAPLPMAAKRALRPRRSPSAMRPTSARLMAAMAGARTQLAMPCRTSDSITGSWRGSTATSSRALTGMQRMATRAASFLRGVASTSAPAGSWLTSRRRA